jgi:hypothetical protein
MPGETPQMQADTASRYISGGESRDYRDLLSVLFPC